MNKPFVKQQLDRKHQFIEHHIKRYHELVLSPTYALISIEDANMLQRLRQTESSTKIIESLRATTSEFNEVLNTSYVVWMDSILHERFSIDGIGSKSFFPRPSYLTGWVCPQYFQAMRCIVEYMERYIEYVAKPWAQEIEGEFSCLAFDPDPSCTLHGEGLDAIAINHLKDFLRVRIESAGNAKDFFQAL